MLMTWPQIGKGDDSVEPKVMEGSLRYIEENLRALITARELADMAGYSLYRYYRLFQAETGMPVMRYILRRKLLAAASEIKGGKKQIDAAFLYGFDTHAGFYRAFRREFGCTPSQYLKNGGVFATQTEKEAAMKNLSNSDRRFLSCKDFYGDPKYGHLAGLALGRLHRELLNADMPVDEVDLFETVRSWALPVCRGFLEIREDFCREYLQELANLCPLLPVQIIHRDPNPSMFYETPEGLALTSSPLSERNARIYDPCYAATAILSESFQGDRDAFDKWLRIYREIIRGYAQEAKTTDAENRAFPYVLLANQFICTTWFYEQQSDPGSFEVNRRMTEEIIREFQRIRDIQL